MMHLTTNMARLAAVAAGLFLATGLEMTPALAQESSTACLGQLMLFGGNYCPRGYTEADGKTLSVQQYSALFSLYGTMYGGNGSTSFGVPDLRGRAPISQGQGPGLPNYTQGQLTGSPTVTLQVANLPPHSHSLNASQGSASNPDPDGGTLAGTPIYNKSAPNVSLSDSAIGKTGSGQSFSVENPVQAIRWCVALQGIYCSRQ